MGRARAEAGRSVVLSRRRVRHARAAAGPPRRNISRRRATASASTIRCSRPSSSIRRWATRISASGLYHYYAAIAPRAARILSALLFLPGGDRAGGLKEMEQTRSKGLLLRGEADYQLHLIYLWYERQPTTALRLIEGLRHALSAQSCVLPAARGGAGRLPSQSSRPRCRRIARCSTRRARGASRRRRSRRSTRVWAWRRRWMRCATARTRSNNCAR